MRYEPNMEKQKINTRRHCSTGDAIDAAHDTRDST